MNRLQDIRTYISYILPKCRSVSQGISYPCAEVLDSFQHSDIEGAPGGRWHDLAEVGMAPPMSFRRVPPIEPANTSPVVGHKLLTAGGGIKGLTERLEA
jgi:hypothetical protein